MPDSFLKIYVIFNVFLLLFAAYIFVRLTRDLAKKSEFVAFKVFVAAYAAYLVFNTLWTLQEYDAVQFPRPVFIAICFFSLASVVFNAFCFFAFTMLHFGLGYVKRRRAKLLGALPLAVSMILLIVSLFNGIIFSVSESNNIVTGKAYIVLQLCAFSYFVVIVWVSVAKAIRLRSRYARRDALGLTACVGFLIVWVLLNNLFDRITIIPIAIFAVIFFLFISLQQSNIYTDALTKLNNRRKSEEYFMSLLESVSEKSPVYFYILDVNSFKEINDRYGHLEGDSALIIVSNALKSLASARSGFTARFGGDEFVWIWRPEKASDEHPETPLCELNQLLKTACRKENKPYVLSISAGYARCINPEKTAEAYLKEADEMMYRNKRSFHEQ